MMGVLSYTLKELIILIRKKLKNMIQKMRTSHHTIYMLLLVCLVVSCGTQQQLTRSYAGKPVSAIDSSFGKPVTILELADDSVYVYEKTEKLRPTEISQGRLTLDPIVTPQVIKTERYYFTVRNGIILKTRMEEEYDR
jgi:hypothetical protein